MRLYALRTGITSIAMLAAVAVPAYARSSHSEKSTDGGTAAAPAAGGTPSSGGAPGTTSPSATPAPAPVTPTAAPVTARSRSLRYRGPVYEVLADGQTVPYVPSSTTPSYVSTGGSQASVADATPSVPKLVVPGTRARYVSGLAAAPVAAPLAVQQMIWAANQIIGTPYVYGGGHDPTFSGPGYDCSGTVSFALHGASLLSAPLDSSSFESWGAAGIGQWVTIFTNPGHAYVDIAGLRLDTSAADDPRAEQGPRWRPLRLGNHGFLARHPTLL